MDWQPIETAPKDGTSFIAGLWVTMWNAARDNSRRYWEVHLICVDDETGEITADSHQGWELSDYSHWMQIPKPPTA